MPATLEPIITICGRAQVWIARSGPEHVRYGDPYTIACVITRASDTTARVEALAIAFGGSTSSASGITYTAASGWTGLPYNTTAASYTSGASYKLQDGSMSSVSTTLTTSVSLASGSCTVTLLLQ